MAARPASAIDLRLLRQFVAVAEELHFRRAARRLAMSQPPLTAAIRRLEAAVGATLLERGNRGVALTPAGATLLEDARALLRQADRAVLAAREAAAGRLGLVRLGYVGSAMYGRLPATIRAFRRTHPGLRLELREATTAAQVAALHAGELDIAIVIPPFGGEAGLHLRPFDADRLAMALPAAHTLAGRTGLRLGDLAGEPFVLWPAREGRGFHDRVIRLCAGAGFVPEVVQEAHGMHAVLSLVAVEAGVSIVPSAMASVRPAEIRYLPLAEEAAAFEHLAARREAGATPAAMALFAALADCR
nr:LysR family transcriptional regulator [Paracraurococcus ruber]